MGRVVLRERSGVEATGSKKLRRRRMRAAIGRRMSRVGTEQSSMWP